ncbi:MAG: LD-carboxypeptidase [Alphaproteobacteria bacterium]|nr:LD-carboxypeptidase [Alphaproteobacteria bacterium]
MYKLQKGDKVAVLAPCGQIGSVEKIQYALDYLKSLGFEPVLGKNVFNTYRYMAGTDTERAADINQAFADREIKAVFCVRAAAGGTRILPYINYETARLNPKPVIGFCDNAALQIALYQKSDIISYNGFVMSYDFKNNRLDSQIKSDLEKLLRGETFSVKSGETLHSGVAKGKLICCNLSVLTKMAGTPYFPDLNGKILLIEDVHEKIHKIDLMLQQLKQQPDFEKLQGLILGQFTDSNCDAEDGHLDDCFNDFLQDNLMPAVKNFDFGHTVSRRVLPQGAEVRLNADKTLLEILQY